MNKLEIRYRVDKLTEMTPLVTSPNLSISVGLTVSVRLGANVFSIENHNMEGVIKLNEGDLEVNREWVADMGCTNFLVPLEFMENVIYAKLG